MVVSRIECASSHLLEKKERLNVMVMFYHRFIIFFFCPGFNPLETRPEDRGHSAFFPNAAEASS